MIFDSSGKDDWDFIRLINKMVNGLRIIKEGNDNYHKIDVRGFSKVYCSGDYYVIVDNKGNIESFVYSNDDRADEEVKEIINSLNKNKSR